MFALCKPGTAVFSEINNSRTVNNVIVISFASLRYNFKTKCKQTFIKEVLRRENQGLKVYSVDGSSVFSMTGTYF